jgi:hypothetical protein
MTNEDPNLENEERDSEETSSEFDELFSEDSETDEDTPVSREEFNNLQKGIKKIATELGRNKSKDTKDETESETDKEVTPEVDNSNSNDVDALFLEQTPEAEEVEDDLKAVAEAKYGGSKVRAWREESWLREKAKSLNDVKKQDEENKSKIDAPDSGISGKVDVTKLTDKDLDDMTPKQRLKALNELEKKEA